ncbi:MAG: class I SAM-dependent methyltransferase [Candidatus Koribacter versatilis]|uniref:Class I SAM-dependent methyltransferase n=1 Tax=Candidatus Korobacter versatilis TaxID=658062 RepID=A0A932EQI4_9BACT|nr:class I SAM-dependent methyltransferase [Candidatus Koribacter versatilis]
MSDTPRAVAASFRDPAGRVVLLPGRVLRAVRTEAVADLDAFLASASAKTLLSSGALVSTKTLDAGAVAELQRGPGLAEVLGGAARVLEHERVWFPAYPYEWSPAMLFEAGTLTLSLAEGLLRDGLGLKDATPYNVLFRGTAPVFVDVLSVERREPRDATWMPYAQFVRTFLLPLVAWQRFKLPLRDVFLGHRDGLEPEDLYRMTGPLARLAPPLLGLVTMPAWLGAKHDQDDQSIYQPKLMNDPERARFVLASQLGSLRKTLKSVAPRADKSTWSDYMRTHSYSDAHFAGKERFVREAVAESAPGKTQTAVLDMGCNTGFFSFLAAERAGTSVVALDYDPEVVDRVFREARERKANVLPLVVDLTRPSPATGWRNAEAPSLLERARGQFDLVLMLAVIHHMLVSERVPLEDILELAADLTCDAAVIEYVDPSDGMFRRLTRGRDALHAGLTRASFEQAAARRFQIVRSLEQGTRTLYFLRKKNA